MPGKYESPAGNGANEALSGGLGSSDFTIDYPIDPIYEAKLLGWCLGRASRQAEIDAANWTADRLYAAMCARSPKPYVDRPSYSDLERVRGSRKHADQIDAANARRFAEASL